jgi:protein SCO1
MWTQRARLVFVSALLACVQPLLHAQKASGQPAESPAHEYFTDVRLVTQDGRSVRFYSDLLKDKVVVINTFFGTCTGSCPRMASTLAALQERLGNRLGKDVFLLSFTVDPENDTPEKLKEYAARFDARPGWLFLTGSKENIQLALSKLGPQIARREDHSTLVMVGNNRTGLWKKVFAGSCESECLTGIVNSVINDKE